MVFLKFRIVGTHLSRETSSYPFSDPKFNLLGRSLGSCSHLRELEMVQKLEAIKGGGGSVRVGTVGKIGSLMTRELEASTSTSRATLKPRTSMGGGCSSNTRISTKHRNPEVGGRTRSQHRISVVTATTPKRQKQKGSMDDLVTTSLCKGTRPPKQSSQIPMLGSENIHLDKTPTREKPTRRATNLSHVVDIHCGSSTASLSNRLKKLGFSKLSQSFM